MSDQQQQAPSSTTDEPLPPSYDALQAPPPPLGEIACEGLDGILAIGPYSGAAVRMMASIKEYAVRSISLDGLFERVKCDLTMMESTIANEDREAEEEQSERRRLLEGAITLQKRYVDLLWETRALATKVEAYLLDFVNAVLPSAVDYTATVADKHAELRSFINRCKPESISPGGETPVRAFLKVEQDLRAFLDEAITFSSDYWQSLNNKNEELKKLNGSLWKQSHDCQEFLTKTPGNIALILGATVIGAVITLRVPPASASIAAAGLGVAVSKSAKIITSIKHMLHVNRQRKSLADLNESTKAVDRIDGVKTRLEEELGRIPNLSELSQRPMDLWDMASEEAALVDRHDLGDIVNDEDLLLRIENITITYKAYASALKELATTVSQAGVVIGRW